MVISPVSQWGQQRATTQPRKLTNHEPGVHWWVGQSVGRGGGKGWGTRLTDSPKADEVQGLTDFPSASSYLAKHEGCSFNKGKRSLQVTLRLITPALLTVF